MYGIANRLRWMLLAALLLFNNAGFARGTGSAPGTVRWANVLLVLGVLLAAWVSYRTGRGEGRGALRGPRERASGPRERASGPSAWAAGHAPTRGEVLAISAVQDLLISAGVWLTGGYESHLFVLYYPSLAVVGLALPLPTSVAYASAVGVVYAALSLLGADVAASGGTAVVMFKVLAERWLALYAMLGLLAWAMRHERAARRRAEGYAPGTGYAAGLQQAALGNGQDELRAAVDRLVEVWQSTTSAIDATALAHQVEVVAADLGNDRRKIEAVIAGFGERGVETNDWRLPAAEASSRMAEMAHDLLSCARPTTAAIEQAHGARRRAHVVVAGWAARSSTVSELASAVRKVADQTNLLAFNASIEAISPSTASAGERGPREQERGRRFAVVADEVRLVAEQATKMAREIDALSVEMWEGTQQVIDALDELGKQLDQASTLTELVLAVGEQQATDAEVVMRADEATGVAAREDAADARVISSTVAGQVATIVRLQDAARRLNEWARVLSDNDRVIDGILPSRVGGMGAEKGAETAPLRETARGGGARGNPDPGV